MKKKSLLIVTAILLFSLFATSSLLVSCDSSNDTALELTDAQSTDEPTSVESTDEHTEVSMSEEITEAETEPIEDTPKNVMIFGDSYSTFAGYIPAGYAAYYSSTATKTDVRKVEQTWWHLLCEEQGYNLVRNDSWSGSTVGYTGYNGADTSGASSFITRLGKLVNQGFFEENDIDIIFVFGCTNDSWANAPLGKLKFSGITRNDLYNVLPAIPYFINKLKEAAPEAEIVFIINTDLKTEIVNAIKSSSERFGTHYVELTRFQKQLNHPSINGMKSIKQQIKNYLNSALNK